MSTMSDIKRAGDRALNTMYSGIPVHGLPTVEGRFAAFGLTENDVEYYCGRIADEIREYFDEQREYGYTPDECTVSVELNQNVEPISIGWFNGFGGADVLTGSMYVPDTSRLADPDYLYEQVSEALVDWDHAYHCRHGYYDDVE